MENKSNNKPGKQYKSIFDDAEVTLSANPEASKPPKHKQVHKPSVNGTGQTGSVRKNDDARRQDAYDLRDYMTQLSAALNTAYNTLGSVTTEGFSFNVVENQINPKLSEVANTVFNIMYNYFNKVVRSKSEFYSEGYRNEAAKFIEVNKAVCTDKDNGGVDARAIRMFFSTLSPLMLSREFTSIDFDCIDTFDDALEVIEYYRYTRFFTPWETNAESNNGYLDAENDTRGEVDINLEYYLQFLCVTPYFKRLLSVNGVSKEIIDCFGNFVLPASKDTALTESSCIDITDQMYGTNDKWMKRFAGSAYAKEIQLDLLNWIKAFKLKAEKILATTADANGIVHNMFNADLAVKLWMQGALNAVWKVMVEDGAGAMDRVNASISRNTADFLPAFIPDIVALVASTNPYFMQQAIDDAKDLLSNGSIYFNPLVYHFVKERFAPNITVYDSRTDRYIDTTKIPARKYNVRIIPKLVLPVNPFDSYCAWVVNNELHSYSPVIHDNGKPTAVGSETGRSPMFTSVKLPDAYLDQRSKTVFVNLTMYFDNMLSYALQVCMTKDEYNPRSCFARLYTDDKFTELSVDDVWSLNKPSSAADKVAGPWIKSTALGNDLVASCQDRYAILGYANTVHGTDVHPLFCATSKRNANGEFDNLASDSAVESTSDSLGKASPDAIISCLEYHTNPLCLRMLSICRYIKESPAMISRRAIANNQLKYFIDGVLDADAKMRFTKSNNMGAPVHQCSSDKIGGLKPSHFFRYSVIEQGGKAYLFDNASCSQNKKMVLLRSVAAAKTIEGRSICYRITNAQVPGNKFNDSIDIRNILLPSDGAIFGIDGIDYEAISQLGDAYCIAQLTNSKGVLADVDATSLSTSRIKHETLPVFIIPKTITSKKYAKYDYGAGWNVFTKRMDVQSEFMQEGATAPTFEDPMCLSDTIWVSERLSDNSLARWARKLSEWNKRNALEYTHESEILMFESIVKQVFAPFSTWKPNVHDIYLPQSYTAAGGTAASAAASDRINMIRYSTSCAFAIGNGNPGDKAWSAGSDDVSILPYMMIDTCRFHNATSVGFISENRCWANIETTESLKRLLKMFVVDECSKYDYNYCKAPYHGQSVPLKRSIFAVDERKLTYSSWLPKINGNEGDY